MESIFLQLEKYSLGKKTSRENLLTELFAYVLRTEPRLKRILLKHLFNGKTNKARKFYTAEIETQKRMYDKSLIDVCFESESGNLFIENKVDAVEGNGQISKYLALCRDNDYLAYLTPRSHKTPIFRACPKHKRTFLGHFHWQDIFKDLRHYNKTRKSDIISGILAYMEDLDMGNMAFSKKDIIRAENAFSFMRKAEVLLNDIWGDFLPELEATFGRNIESKSAQHSNWIYDNIYCLYRRPKWSFGLYLFVMVGEDGTPYLTFGPGCYKKQFISLLKSDSKVMAKAKSLERLSGAWENCNEDTWWDIGKYWPLKPKSLGDLKSELMPKLNIALRELRRTKLIPMLVLRSKRTH